jgi:hypothetical protein
VYYIYIYIFIHRIILIARGEVHVMCTKEICNDATLLQMGSISSFMIT